MKKVLWLVLKFYVESLVLLVDTLSELFGNSHILDDHNEESQMKDVYDPKVSDRKE